MSPTSVASPLDVSGVGARAVIVAPPELVAAVDAVVVDEVVVDELVVDAEFVVVDGAAVAELSALLVDVELLLPEVPSLHAASSNGAAKQKIAL